MLEFVPPGLQVDFVGKAKGCIIVSVIVILIGIASILWRGGLNQGIDFSGGTLLQLRLRQPVDLGTVRAALSTLGLERSIVQHYGDTHEVLIRVAQMAGVGQDVGAQVQRILQDRFPGQTIELRRTEAVGAQVSTDLRRQALFALLYAILGTGIYISGRFEAKWFVALGLAAGLFVVTYTIPPGFLGLSPLVVIVGALVAFVVLSLLVQLLYALAAIVAIYHDVLVTVGFLALFDKEFDLQIIAALLTIIGYSLNDTIVIFDRIRENMRGSAAGTVSRGGQYERESNAQPHPAHDRPHPPRGGRPLAARWGSHTRLRLCAVRGHDRRHLLNRLYCESHPDLWPRVDVITGRQVSSEGSRPRADLRSHAFVLVSCGRRACKPHASV